MRTTAIAIPLKPRPKQSAREGKYGFYNPSSKGMTLLRNQLRLLHRNPPYKSPVLLILHLHLPLSPQRKRSGRVTGDLHVDKPDGDNLEKFFCDAANGVLFDDDAGVSVILRIKTFGGKEGHYSVFMAELEQRQYEPPELLAILGELTKLNPWESHNVPTSPA